MSFILIIFDNKCEVLEVAFVYFANDIILMIGVSINGSSNLIHRCTKVIIESCPNGSQISCLESTININMLTDCSNDR